MSHQPPQLNWAVSHGAGSCFSGMEMSLAWFSLFTAPGWMNPWALGSCQQLGHKV